MSWWAVIRDVFYYCWWLCTGDVTVISSPNIKLHTTRMTLHMHVDMTPKLKGSQEIRSEITLIARVMGPTWVPPGADRTHVGPMWATWTLLSGNYFLLKHRGRDKMAANFQSTFRIYVPVWHASIWTIYGLFFWSKYASLRLHELAKNFRIITYHFAASTGHCGQRQFVLPSF